MKRHYGPGDTVLNNWTLVRLIGEGSFGRVFEAERKDFGNTYKAAIKIITIPYSEAEITNICAEMGEGSVTTYFRSFVEEIVREFALMSQLKGTANVVSYEDHAVVQHSDDIGWDVIIRMELLTPLLDYSMNQPFSSQDAIKLGIDICRALELCQKFNILHRDIKPENIFVSSLGDYKLGDFGIARTAERTMTAGTKRGTYTYMAPEVYRGEVYGPCVDIYSLGIVLYRMLNDNRTPFLPAYPAHITHSDREKALAKRINGTQLPLPKNADGKLAKIILKACAYNPKNRYPSPIKMRQALEAILHHSEDSIPINPLNDPDTDSTKNNLYAHFSTIKLLKKTATVFRKFKKPEAEVVKSEPVESDMDATESILDEVEPLADRLKYKARLYARFVKSNFLEQIKKYKLPVAFGVFAVVIAVLAIVLVRTSTSEELQSGCLPPDYPTTDYPTSVPPPVIELDLSNRNLTDYDVALLGLEDMAYLIKLDLSGNQVSDLTVLSRLANLTTLNLSRNNISNLAPLYRLQNLEQLDLRYNPIDNLSHVIGIPYVFVSDITIGDNQYSTSLNELHLIGLGLTDDDIKPLRFMPNLTALRLDNNQISDLTPLSYLTGLTTLNLRGNNISDLAPLAGLLNLERLDLRDNSIINFSYVMDVPYVLVSYITIGNNQHCASLYNLDLIDLGLTDEGIRPLRFMPNLTTLRLGNNQITDLTPLSRLTNLTILNLRGNNISDLAPLAGLPYLEQLDLSSNEISDLASMSGLVNLAVLNLRWNSISDTTPLSGLSYSVWLDLRDNYITNWGPVIHVFDLWGPTYITIGDEQHSVLSTDLNLSGLYLTDEDIVPLRHVRTLTTLRLGSNQVRDLVSLSRLTNLTTLNLNGNSIYDLIHLSGLPNLELIDLSNNQISDLTPLSDLVKLRRIHLSNNYIEDPTPLSDLPNLQMLDLTNNPIIDWMPVIHVPDLRGIGYISIRGEQHRVSLTELDLSGRNLTNEDIVPLRHMRSLRTLRLDNNQISNLTSLSSLANLTELSLRNNNISDLTPLSGLSRLRHLDLRDNNITNWSPVDHVPTVLGRPVSVPRVSVPRVVGYSESDARRVLEARGFRVSVRYQPIESGVIGSVTSQNPASNSLQDRGSTVTIIVNRIPPPS